MFVTRNSRCAMSHSSKPILILFLSVQLDSTERSPNFASPSMGNNHRPRRWSWTSAIIGAATTAAAAAILIAKPKDPTFSLISINLTKLHLNFPFLDADLILTVHSTNPNIVSVRYSSTTMSILYDDSLLGSAIIDAGEHAARSCRVLRLPATVKGMELASKGKRFLEDLGKREMELGTEIEFDGVARVGWWGRRFRVKVDSRVVVDPVLLDVIEQENRSKIELFNV
ncbi:hypothetical protein Droror1_Dr00003174 [Drosera rotundifolia]